MGRDGAIRRFLPDARDGDGTAHGRFSGTAGGRVADPVESDALVELHGFDWLVYVPELADLPLDGLEKVVDRARAVRARALEVDLVAERVSPLPRRGLAGR